MYCGGVTDAPTCTRCLAAQPAFAGVDIAAWRARHGGCLRRAAFRIAPSQWAADMLRPLFPDCRRRVVIPHGTATSRATAHLARAHDVAAARRRRAGRRRARRDRSGQGRAASRTRWSSLRARAAPLRFVADRLHRRRARPVAIRRRAASPSTAATTRADLPRLACALSRRARALSVGGSGNVQLHAVRSVGSGPARARAADRRARRARARQRRGMGAGRRRVADEAEMLARVVALHGTGRRARALAAASKALDAPHASTQPMADATLVLLRRAISSGARTRHAAARLHIAACATRWATRRGNRLPSLRRCRAGWRSRRRRCRCNRGRLMARVAPARARNAAARWLGRVLYRMTPAPRDRRAQARLDG